VDDSIRRSGRVVQGVAASLLRMHPAERRPFIRPLIVLIEHVLDGDTGSFSASSMLAEESLS
jgi:hypothetical protein